MSTRDLTASTGFSAEDEEILALLLAEEGIDLADGTAIPLCERVGDLPLSFAQERLWLVDRLAPGSAAYNLPSAIRLEGALDASALAATLDELVRRHEPLRTVFPVRDGGPVQVILPAGGLPLRRVDLAGVPAARREEEARRLATEEARRPFDLAAGPLLRAVLLAMHPGAANGGAAAADHLMLLTLHHIVSDGWSQGVLLRELGALYAAFRAGRPSPLPPLPIQYADFAVWQRRTLSGAALEGELAFWRQELAGLRRIELPADRPRPPVLTSRGGMHRLRLPARIEAGLAGLARAEGATLYMALLAAVAALLSRHTGEEDVAVGSPIANRNRAETEGLIGFFVNTLVLRTDCAGGPTLRRLLGRVREAVLAAFAHQDLPFERVVEELAPRRDPSRTPLFQTMFALQNAGIGGAPGGGALRLPGLTLRPLDLGGEPAKFDLTLAFAEGAEGVSGIWGYNRDLFDGATVARLAAHLEVLLAAALASPQTPLADLPLLTDGERAQLVREWNATATAYPRDATIPELFRRQAGQAADRVAAVWGDRALTYGELRRRASRLARRMRALGVGADSAVGLYLPRSLDLVIGMLAALEAGGAYVPLAPGLPRERLQLLLRDVGAALVLTRTDLLGELPEGTASVLCMDSTEPGSDELGDAPPPRPALSPDNLAYVVYTSGSTGAPKGVAVPHRAVVRLVRETDYVRLGPADRVAHVSNPSFDAATFEIWGALLNGALLVVIDRDVVLAPRELGARLVERGVSALFVTTALFNQMAREAPEALAAVGSVLFGGEAVDPAWVRRALAPAPRGRLLHVYGPTENTTFTTWHHVGEVEPGAATVPIGQPLANTTVHLLDRERQPVPVGVGGELYTGGDGLARGYFGRPELTAERFVPDPFGAPGGRLYRTGDLARRRPDGAIEFLGRIDDQVKIRGFRIEPGEVEAALRRHPEVREAAVLVREGERAGEDRRLVAYVAPAEGSALGAATLRAFLKERLPDYLVPAAFALVPALPLNANGKVDRRALLALGAEPERGAGERAGDPTPPRTPTEELLQAIWGEALGIDPRRLGTDEDFFALGGHSLLATRVISRVRQTFGAELPLRRLFEAPTIAALAREIEAERAGGEAGLPPILPAPRAAPPPLSFAQERLWFLDQLQPGGALYNVPLAIRSSGELDVPALAAALSAVVGRHEAVRTTFAVIAGRPVQVIHPPARLALPHVDLAGLPAARRETEARRLAAAEARRPFDLAAGPLLRGKLLRLTAGEHLALLTLHHIVSDGWSMGVLMRELGALYAAFGAGRPSPLPPLPVQYADFAVWQRRTLAGEVLEREVAYWRRTLAGLAPLELPTDRPRPPVVTSAGASRSLRLPAALGGALADLARTAGTTLYMALLAAVAALLSRHTGGEDVAVGSPIANRNRAEIEGLIGFFVNTLVQRLDCAGEPPFRELLGRARETVLAAFAHQDLPFERVVEELAPQRDPSRTPLFQVMFALQNAGETLDELRLPGLTLRPVEQESGQAKFDLTLAFAEGAEGLRGMWGYNRDLFDRTTVARLASHLEAMLLGIVAAPERRITELPLLGAGERAQLVWEWNATATAYPRQASIAELFCAQAERAPEAVALVSGEETLTYGELSRRSGRLARRLLARGVSAAAESAVGLYLPRSLDMVVAILAVLEAGGVYVPLDPGHPRERVAFLLRDVGAALVLTRSDLRHRLPEDAAPALLLDRPDPEADALASPPAPVGRAASPDSLAYVLYTSGSTGTPKGVAVPHRAVVRLVRETDYVRFGRDQVFLHLAPPTFDAATLEIWGALLHGARLAIAPPGALAIEEIGELLARHAVTTLWLTAGLFHQVVDGHLEILRPLRQLLAGGDVLGVEPVRRLLAELPGMRLVNGYGPTENTTFTCAAPLAAGTAIGASVPLGRPIANTRVHLVDRWLQPVPIGVTGELCAAGDGLARGYLGRPELTAERFVPDPLGEPGGRLYRTGDLARRRRDGTIEFLGRLDDQVKIRGFRIEPGEVEAALCRHPGVRQAAVLVRQGERAGEDRRLVAYLSVDESGLSAAALRAFLAEQVPEYLIPSAFVLVPELPLNANGKVDRRALPALGAETERGAGERAGDPARDPVLPRTPAEELLLAIWSETLGLDPAAVGTDDNFFELGGHSLLATRVVSQVRRTFGVELPLRRLFEAPTIAALAREVEGLRAGGDAGLMPILPAPRAEPPPLSFAQERLWFLDQLQPGGFAYNVPLAVRLSGALDAGALAAALAEVVRRHEAVRTTFALADGRPVQVIHPAGAAGPARRRPRRAAGGAARGRGAPADARGGAAALRPRRRPAAAGDAPAPDRRRGAPGAPHPASHRLGRLVDGGPGARAGSALRRLPRRASAGAPAAADPVRGLRGLAAADPGGRGAGSGARPLAAGARRPRPAGAADRPPAPADADLGRRHARLPPAGGAGQGPGGSRAGGGRDALHGPPRGGGGAPRPPRRRRGRGGGIAHRQPQPGRDGGADRLLRQHPGAADRRLGEPAVRELLARVRETVLAAFAHQDLPFERVVEALAPPRDPSRTPLFQVMLVLQNATDKLGELRLPGLALRPLETVDDVAKFDLTLTFAEAPQGLGGTWSYNRDLFDRTTVARLAGHLEALLSGMVEAPPERRVAHLPLLAAGERAQLVREWNATSAEVPETTLAALFRAQAERTPEAIAVIGGEAALSYGELARRSARIALRLAAEGAGAGSRVGICAERSPELLAGILGILAAGAAYVPLDPDYPDERLAFMLADAAPAALLIQPHLVARLGSAAARRVPLDPALDGDLEGDLDGDLNTAGALPAPADGLAYVLYTSGSTGRPKGVMVSHRAIVNHLLWMQSAYPLGAGDRVLLKTSICFDVSVGEIFAPLFAGAGLVLARPGGQRDPAYLAAEVERRGITVLQLVPTLLQALRRGRVGGGAAALAAAGAERRRGAVGQAGGELPGLLRGGRGAGQHLRPDGGGDRHHRAPLPSGGHGCGCGERAAGGDDRQRRGPPAGPSAGAGADRRRGRALHRRDLPGPRLPRAAGPDGGAVRAERDRRGGGGEPALPHRRPRPPAGRRHAGVPRAGRPPGEDPRLPRRAGRDRGGGRRRSRGARGGGGRPRRGRRAPARRLRRAAGGAARRTSPRCAGRRASACRRRWCRRAG